MPLSITKLILFKPGPRTIPITEKKLYIPVVILSTNGNAKTIGTIKIMF